jgi:hypothetical protein
MLRGDTATSDPIYTGDQYVIVCRSNEDNRKDKATVT